MWNFEDEHAAAPRSLCLDHQVFENQATPAGMMCEVCKQLYYTHSHSQPLRVTWESQPQAYSLRRSPCFVQRRSLGDLTIRSLHPPDESAETKDQPTTMQLIEQYDMFMTGGWNGSSTGDARFEVHDESE